MSRGYGRVQTAIIGELMAVGRMTVEDLCVIIHRGQATTSQLKNLRTALGKLEQRKIVKQEGFSNEGKECWAFLGVNADRTGERQRLMRNRLRLAEKPRLVTS